MSNGAEFDRSGAADTAPAAYTCRKMRSGRCRTLLPPFPGVRGGSGGPVKINCIWLMRRPAARPDGVRTASRPHLSPIFYPPFLTTHFYLLITWLILKHIPESFNPNLDETQSIILNASKRVGALVKFRVLETRKTCTIFYEMEEVLKNNIRNNIFPRRRVGRRLPIMPGISEDRICVSKSHCCRWYDCTDWYQSSIS